MIGQKIKLAVEKSDFTPDQIAAHAEMSTANLYRIYKRDSIESRYLVKIAEILNLPYSYFLDEGTELVQSATGQQVQQAHKVGSNNQSISVGQEDFKQKFEACEREKALLEKSLADKEMIIELLKGQR